MLRAAGSTVIAAKAAIQAPSVKQMSLGPRLRGGDNSSISLCLPADSGRRELQPIVILRVSA